MPIYQCDPNVELNGDTTYAFLTSAQSGEFASILRKYDLEKIDRAAWYPLQQVLNVLKEISQSQGAMMNMVSIGIAAIDNLELPDSVTSLTPDQFLKLYEQLYPKRHRNGYAGTVRAASTGPNHASLTLDADVPYPDDVMYGVVYGYIRRLVSVKDFSVEYGGESLRRENGGQETVIEVTWTG